MKPIKTSHSFIPAPLWRRLAAILYDMFLVIALLFAVGFINLGIQMIIYGEAELRQMTSQGSSLDGPVFYIALLLTMFVFFTYCWTKKGQTLGMQAWKIKIINNNGQFITFRQSLLRFIIAIPSLLLIGIGIFWMKADPDKKSWQDRLSRSITILDK
ncbi:RDD family protein [Endozoicomonas sp. Mp262]|uniref:RDD family protein n=1 Tax=Endozoicomonas sp. Mp262 TaxID=2919499 RepID=UPI0021DABF49